MTTVEPRPWWGWAIKGLGGVINIMESWIAEKMFCDANQLEMLEYQTARLFDVLEKCKLHHNVPEWQSVRRKEIMRASAGFSAEDVIESPPPASSLPPASPPMVVPDNKELTSPPPVQGPGVVLLHPSQE